MLLSINCDTSLAYGAVPVFHLSAALWARVLEMGGDAWRFSKTQEIEDFVETEFLTPELRAHLASAHYDIEMERIAVGEVRIVVTFDDAYIDWYYDIAVVKGI